MRLEHRLQCLELKWVTQKHGCNITLFIVAPQDCQDGTFDSDAYRPGNDEIEKYIKNLKSEGNCQGCQGSCAIDWSPDGFKNHTLEGEGSSSSPEPKINFMFCADAEITVLCRRIMNSGREHD